MLISDTTAPTAPKVPKVVKAPFTIDFSGPGPSTKTLFASSSKASITLSKPKGQKDKDGKRQKREEYLLPDDMHFSSRELLRLFLKPKYSVRPLLLVFHSS
jgi:condensin complex subunit 2